MEKSCRKHFYTLFFGAQTKKHWNHRNGNLDLIYEETFWAHMTGLLRNFQPALKNVFLKIKKTCTYEKT